MLRRLQQILSDTGLVLGDEEILDVLWLASRLPRGSRAPLVSMIANGLPASDSLEGMPGAASLDRLGGQDNWATNADSTRQDDSDSERRDACGPPGSARTTPLVGANHAGDSADRRLLVPGLTALGGDLAFGRALRPLKRRTPSTHATEVAEVATAEAQADTGVAQVVLRPQLERWLRLSLIIDNANSMLLWEQHCRELLAVFERSGAFRQITVHQLHHGTPSAPRSITLTRPWQNSAVPSLTPHAATDPSGRTMVIVVTDGAAPAWRDGRMRELLQDWAAVGPAALIHVLPRQLWARTGVNTDTWHVKASRAGEPNANWRLTKPFVPPQHSRPPAVSIPVLELRPPSFASWARALTTVGHPVPLRLWEPNDDPRTSAARPATSAHTFIRTATPHALRLAAHLAACAPLTVPVMQLVHACLPGRHHSAALAEVFLSGQLTPLPVALQRSGELRHRFYDFAPEAKDLLMDAIPAAELVSCGRRVGERMESLAGHSRDFPAWLLASSNQPPDVGAPHPFAHVGESFLARIGRIAPIKQGRTSPAEPPAPERRGVGIICSSAEEFSSVLDHLKGVRHLHSKQNDGQLARGHLHGTQWDVFITLAGPSAPSVVAAAGRLESLHLDAILILEVESGVRRGLEQGGIVVATSADQVVFDGEATRPDPHRPAWTPSPRLELAARRALRDTGALFAPVVTTETALLTADSTRTILQANVSAGSISLTGTSLIRIARKFPNLDVLLIQTPGNFVPAKRSDISTLRIEPGRAAASAVAVLREIPPRPEPPETSSRQPAALPEPMHALEKSSVATAASSSRVVALITAPRPLSAGSRLSFLGTGVRVGARLVLTAEHIVRSGHVVAHITSGAVTAASVRNFQVVWADAHLDAALLLLIDRSPVTGSGAPPPRQPWASLSPTELVHPCFVECLLPSEDGSRTLKQVRGRVSQISLKSGTYEFAPDLPLSDKDSKGMSGAPVYFNECLVGLVVAASHERNKEVRLRISDIAALAKNRDFINVCSDYLEGHPSLIPISTAPSSTLNSKQDAYPTIRIVVDRSGAPSLHEKVLLLLRVVHDGETSIRIHTDQNDVEELQSLAQRLEDDPSVRVQTRIVRNAKELGAVAEVLALHVATVGPIGLLTGAVTAWLMTRKSRAAVHLSTADGREVTITGNRSEEARALMKTLLDDL